MKTEQAIQETRDGTLEAVKILADRIRDLEVKCENLEGDNKRQAEEIFRLNGRVATLERDKDTVFFGLDSLSRARGNLNVRLEVLEERLAKLESEGV